ncbi:MAG: O-antigen ligase family protein, partial [Sulfuricella sp.]
MNSFAARYSLALWPAAFFLFILPFTHTVALRLSSLGIAAAIAFVTWRTRSVPPVPFKLPLLLWVGMALLSLSWAIDPAYSLREIKNEIGYAMVCFFTFYGMTQGEREWKLWNRALMIGFLAISASAISACWIAGDWVTDGPHGGVGDYSTYLILILPFILLAAVKNPLAGFPVNPAWLLLPILLVGGQLTLNRTFWPALLAVSASFILLYHFRTRPFRINRKILGIAILLGILTATPFIETVKDKAVTTGTNTEILARTFQQDQRIPLWSFVIERISERPLTGAGFGRGALRQTLTNHFKGSQLWHAHNLFLNYALQMGVGGVLVLTLLFWALAREFWRLYRSTQPDASLIGIAGLALLSGVIVKNMTDDFLVRHLALLFWALAGISLGYGRRLLLQKMSNDMSQNQTNLLHAAMNHVPSPSGPQFLVIRRDNIGDLICTTPLIHALRQQYPGATICALVNSYNAPVLANNPDIDAVFAYTKAKHRPPGTSVAGVYWDRLQLFARLRRMRFDYAILAAPRFQPRLLRLARLAGARRI